MRELNEVIANIEKLNGATVNYWGENHTLPTIPTEDDFTIDTLDILRNLRGYDIDADYFILWDEDKRDDYIPEEIEEAWNCDSWDIDFSLMDTLENYGYMGKEIVADNTYNWCAPLSHHIDFRVFDDIMFGGVFVFLQVHRFGDVRGNYEGFTLLHFDSIDSFYEAFYYENSKTVEIEVDCKKYYVELQVYSDCYEVYNEDWDEICTAYGDADDVKEKIMEAIS